MGKNSFQRPLAWQAVSFHLHLSDFRYTSQACFQPILYLIVVVVVVVAAGVVVVVVVLVVVAHHKRNKKQSFDNGG